MSRFSCVEFLCGFGKTNCTSYDAQSLSCRIDGASVYIAADPPLLLGTLCCMFSELHAPKFIYRADVKVQTTTQAVRICKRKSSQFNEGYVIFDRLLRLDHSRREWERTPHSRCGWSAPLALQDFHRAGLRLRLTLRRRAAQRALREQTREWGP